MISVTFYVAQTEKLVLTIENQIIKNSKFEKLLDIKFDSELNFNSHMHDICQKAGQKLNAISRITPYMDFVKRRLIVNAFFYSQFNYCQLVWMCHNRTNNNKVNRLHERCLRLIYNDKKSSFEDLLQKDGSVSIRHRNLRTLALEYNMRNYSYFAMPRAKTVNHGLESLSYIGAELWDSIPSHMTEIDSINEFKHVIKTWKPDLCSCRLCKVYMQNIGYL